MPTHNIVARSGMYLHVCVGAVALWFNHDLLHCSSLRFLGAISGFAYVIVSNTAYPMIRQKTEALQKVRKLTTSFRTEFYRGCEICCKGHEVTSRLSFHHTALSG